MCSRVAQCGANGSSPVGDGERGLDATFDHPSLAFDQLELAEPQQILRVIFALGRALPGQFGIFAVEGRQAELLEVVLQQNLRCIRHAAAPVSSTA